VVRRFCPAGSYCTGYVNAGNAHPNEYQQVKSGTRLGTTEEDLRDTTEASPWMRPFVPPRFLRSGHLQTIVGNVLPLEYPRATCLQSSPDSLFK
jgi:hypothetical protein